MGLDLFASARSTALVALVTASLSSPILVKSDALASVGAKFKDKGAKTEPAEQLVAGGVEFAMPAKWGRLGSSAAASGGHERIGTPVSALCPGGGSGAECADGVQLTFIAYSGKEGHALPVLSTFEVDLDRKLRAEFPGFHKVDAKMRPGADGIRYLDYTFTWKQGRAIHDQRFAAYRNQDGSGVVAVATGAKLLEHAKAIDAFLATAHDPLDALAAAEH